MFSLGKQNHQLPLREENTQKSLVLLYSLGEHNLDRLLLLYTKYTTYVLLNENQCMIFLSFFSYTANLF